MKLLLTLLALAVLAAGCGGIGGGSSYQTPPTEEHAEHGEVYKIKATGGNDFTPQFASVPVGATVMWEVEGSVPHNVKAGGGEFDSDDEFGGNMQRGDQFFFTFDEAGTYGYECDLHAGMTGTIKVE